MDHRMRLLPALILLLLLLKTRRSQAFVPGADGPVSMQEGLEGANTTLLCDTSTEVPNDELMLLVWYENNAPIYSYDARVGSEWSSNSFNASGRLIIDRDRQPTTLTITHLREDDEALYHCRVDFLLTPTRNLGVNLSVTVLPSKPFFLDEVGNKVENKIGPYHEGDTLVLSCLVIGGRPEPHISWYSGNALVDGSDGASDIPRVRENELYLPLSRDHTGPLSCRASNTKLAQPVVATLQIDLYLPAQNVTIHWVDLAENEALQAGRKAVAQCVAFGSRPAPDLSWWLDHRHLTKHSNQSLTDDQNTAVSYLELTPTVGDNGATLTCIATNVAMAPSRGSKAEVITLNVTYSPIVEVSRIGNGRMNELVELDTLHLLCEVRANPPVDKIEWYFNDSKIMSGGLWGDSTSSAALVVDDASRVLAGRYSCAAANTVGETRAHQITIVVLYSPECRGKGVTLNQETLSCDVNALPPPDTYFWHVTPRDLETQRLTTGSALLPLSQINGPITGLLHVSCKAGNGVASQDKSCEANFSFEYLRPPQPKQCDLVFEHDEFQMRCIAVENATYYEVSVWRMSSSNTSLILEHRGAMGWGNGGQALTQGGVTPWLVRGALGKLKAGDEAGASACNRFGCSRALLLRPTESLLHASAPPWWQFFLERDVGISIGAVILVAVFLISTFLAVQLARRTRKPPVVQVLQLDDVAREYLDALENKRHVGCSARSCSSGYSGGSLDSEPPIVDRHRKPIYYWEPGPPPDVTLTLHRESAV